MLRIARGLTFDFNGAMPISWTLALVGGLFIGLAASIMLLLQGRVAGISGILNGLLTLPGERLWRGSFLAGLLGGGALMWQLWPEAFNDPTEISTTTVVIAGLLVGFGTVMGGGCTSGHGVCGLSRFSIRSLVATVTFMVTGILTVAIVAWLGRSS